MFASEPSIEKGYRDLSSIIITLLEHWTIVLGATLLFAVGGLVIRLLIAPTYEATAELVTRMSGTADDDQSASFTTADLQRMATTDMVLEQALDDLPHDSFDREVTLGELRSMIRAEVSSDPGVLNLSIVSPEPELASALVGAWANAVVEHIGQLMETIELGLGEQVEVSQRRVRQLDQALSQFYAESQLTPLQLQLEGQREFLTAQQQQHNDLTVLSQNIETLRFKLSNEPSDTSTSEIDQIVALGLELQTFDLLGARTGSVIAPNRPDIMTLPGVENVTTSPENRVLLPPQGGAMLQLELPLTILNVEQLTADLAIMQGVVDEKLRINQEQLDSLVRNIATLEAEILALEAQRSTLLIDRDLEIANYQVLKQQLLLFEHAPAQLPLVEVAGLPGQSMSQGLSAIEATIAGALLGLILGATGVLVVKA